MTTHLILADDNPTIQQFVQLCFRDEPVDVVCVSDGREALECLARRPVDILLADVSLPGLDGYSLCRRVKQDPRTAHVPVVLLAGAFVRLDQPRVEGSGAHCVLQKPLGTAQLVELIGKVLGAPAAEAPMPEHPEPPQDIDLQIPHPRAGALKEDLFELDSRELFSPPPAYRWRLVRGDEPRRLEEAAPADPAEKLVRELTDRLQAELPRFVSEAALSVRQRPES